MDKNNTKTFEMEFGGRPLIIETGRLAKQAHGSCTVRYGDTVVLATAVIGGKAREGMNYFPLVVDYEEKLYAAGKIKGSRFIKREGRPSDEAVLTARLVDRAIRPLFDERIRNEIQVILTVLCWDGENDPDFPSLLAASVALSISKIPWEGKVVGIKIGMINGEWVINPTYKALESSDIELMLAFTDEKKLIMIEAGANEVSDEKIFEAIEFGQGKIGKVISIVEEAVNAVGDQKLDADILIEESLEEQEEETEEELEKHQQMVRGMIDEHVESYLFNQPVGSKGARKAKLAELKNLIEEEFIAQKIGKEKRQKALEIFETYIEQHITRAIVEQGKRVDGRSLTEIRQISSDVGLLPRVHGSGLFNRGETQVMSIVTLGSPGDEQVLDTMEESGKKRYMHHYNFPGFSVGEPKRVMGPGRREIGHGALAEKALKPMLPDKNEFPYTIRVVSEVLGSNGSSSMASVCGSTLALMDAGVPIKKPVAGIAMGLASDDNGNFKVLTDLQDLEDGPGGMDFKIAGTRDGVTAIQMDTKTKGLTMEIVKKTIAQARDALNTILDQMKTAISEPRGDLSPYAPRITTLHIQPEKIRDIIGPGGKVISAIINATYVAIDIEDDGLVMVTSTNKEDSERAVAIIKEITREFTPGEILHGTVSRVENFGAFVEIDSSLTEVPEGVKVSAHEGMVHISELAPFRVNEVEDIVKIGDRIPVRVIEVDDLGRLSLSLKGTDFKFPSVSDGSHGARDERQTGSRRRPSYVNNRRDHGRSSTSRKMNHR